MSLAESRTAVTLPAVTDELMMQWLDTAEERISAVHGVIGADQLAVYRWIDLSRELQLTQQASALVSVEADGGPVEAVLSAGGWGIRRTDGRYWQAQTIEVVYTPEERMATRKEMQRQMLLGYAATNGYSQQTLGGAMIRPDREFEDRALAMLPLPWLITDNYPSHVTAAPSGDE